MTLEQAKLAIKNDLFVDFHFEDDKPGMWRWMNIRCLSDDETCVYYRTAGSPYSCTALKNIIIDKFG